MFVTDSDNRLVFIKSKNIKAFPCGRRRSSSIDLDNNPNTVAKSYIPFDPEARLNTESNNRKHSSLNGFKNTYFNRWTENSSKGNVGSLSFVINGYFFDIELPDGYTTPDEFGAKLFAKLVELGTDKDANKIYAKIRLASIQFFSAGVDKADIVANSLPVYTTQVLRDWSGANSDGAPKACLDLFKKGSVTNDSGGSKNPQEDINNYYFSGVAFTAEPSTNTEAVDEVKGIFYLPLLEKVSEEWQICETSRLPKINHGSTENSISVSGDISSAGTISANTLNSTVILQNGKPVIQLELVQTQDNPQKYKLKFTGGTGGATIN